MLRSLCCVALFLSFSFFFFFNDTATTEIYTLSLHDALPISSAAPANCRVRRGRAPARSKPRESPPGSPRSSAVASRSEEHTSELQSRLHLVCRLLLEKKKKAEARNCRQRHSSQQPTVAPCS